MNYIDTRIKKTIILNKGYGFVAKKNIPKGTIIIKEQPPFFLDNNEKNISDMFQLLYKILTCNNKKKIKQFMNLVPNITTKFTDFNAKIEIELDKLKNSHLCHIYNFFKENYTSNEILLFCIKYICNAFDFGGGSAILFIGTLLNHSCMPNVIFYRKNNLMYFVAARDIDAGEEICDNYVDITLKRKVRQQRLLNQYGFQCECVRCSTKRNRLEYDNYAKSLVAQKKNKKINF